MGLRAGCQREREVVRPSTSIRSNTAQDGRPEMRHITCPVEVIGDGSCGEGDQRA